MRYLRLIATARANLRRNRLRTVLSLVGVVIGVFSVTIIVSLGYGLRGYILNYLDAFGTNTLAINPAAPGLADQGPFAGGPSTFIATSLKESDVDAIERSGRFPYIDTVIGMRMDQGTVTQGNKNVRGLLIAAGAGYMRIDGQAELASGRFYSERDEDSLLPVAVIGSGVAETLFGDEDPLGRKIRVKNASLEVVGVMEPRGAIAGFDFDNVVFIPLKFGIRRLVGGDHVTEIDVRVTDKIFIAAAKEDLETFMRERHGIKDPSKDDFRVTSSTEVIDTVETVTGTLTILLGLLAAISLVVGGIGIMNIMLVSVTDRIREIGLRKALGASDRELRDQYLIESVILTSGGGVIGGLLGIALTAVGVFAARQFGYDVPYILSLPALLVALVVSVVVGLVFGAYPARMAAKLDPITALRYE